MVQADRLNFTKLRPNSTIDSDIPFKFLSIYLDNNYYFFQSGIRLLTCSWLFKNLLFSRFNLRSLSNSEYCFSNEIISSWVRTERSWSLLISSCSTLQIVQKSIVSKIAFPNLLLYLLLCDQLLVNLLICLYCLITFLNFGLNFKADTNFFYNEKPRVERFVHCSASQSSGTLALAPPFFVSA